MSAVAASSGLFVINVASWSVALLRTRFGFSSGSFGSAASSAIAAGLLANSLHNFWRDVGLNRWAVLIQSTLPWGYVAVRSLYRGGIDVAIFVKDVVSGE